jgi:hypothetical protein
VWFPGFMSMCEMALRDSRIRGRAVRIVPGLGTLIYFRDIHTIHLYNRGRIERFLGQDGVVRVRRHSTHEPDNTSHTPNAHGGVLGDSDRVLAGAVGGVKSREAHRSSTGSTAASWYAWKNALRPSTRISPLCSDEGLGSICRPISAPRLTVENEDRCGLSRLFICMPHTSHTRYLSAPGSCLSTQRRNLLSVLPHHTRALATSPPCAPETSSGPHMRDDSTFTPGVEGCPLAARQPHHNPRPCVTSAMRPSCSKVAQRPKDWRTRRRTIMDSERERGKCTWRSTGCDGNLVGVDVIGCLAAGPGR